MSVVGEAPRRIVLWTGKVIGVLWLGLVCVEREGTRRASWAAEVVATGAERSMVERRSSRLCLRRNWEGARMVWTIGFRGGGREFSSPNLGGLLDGGLYLGILGCGVPY